MDGGFGRVPLSWRDLVAWQTCSGIVLPPWQARLMIELSREFCAFLRKAEKPNCPAPWSEEAVAENRRAAIARELRVGFKAIMLSKKGK